MLVGVTLPTITSFPVYDYCDVLSAMSVLVQVSQLDELVSKLKKDIPKSLPVSLMSSTVKGASRSKVLVEKLTSL